MSQLEKIAEIVARLCNEFMEINADGKVTITDFPEVVNVLKEISDLMGVDKLEVMNELDNLSHEKIDSILAVFGKTSDIDDETKLIVIDSIRAALDMAYAIDTLMDHFVRLNS